MAGKILLSIDTAIFETKTYICHIPKYLWFNTNFDERYKEQKPIDYIFGLIFFSIYLFFVLLFRSNWVTSHFFVTHRIIKRQLKRLNSDITHSTERENSVNIQSKGIGTGIGTRTKKSRGGALPQM